MAQIWGETGKNTPLLSDIFETRGGVFLCFFFLKNFGKFWRAAAGGDFFIYDVTNVVFLKEIIIFVF